MKFTLVTEELMEKYSTEPPQHCYSWVRVTKPSSKSPYLWHTDCPEYEYDRWGFGFKTVNFKQELKEYFKKNNIKSLEKKAYILNHLMCYYDDYYIYTIKTGGDRIDVFDVYYCDNYGKRHFIYHNGEVQ